jgi:gliding motility-associated lipoprotein GldB
MRLIYVFAVLLLLCLGCKNDDSGENRISKIEMNVSIERFDREFAKAKPRDLETIKKTYPFLFSKQVEDTVWLERMKDTLQQQLFEEVDAQFGDFKQTEAEIKSLFKHIKFYDKSFTAPRVITLTNDVDYRYPVVVTDTIVLLALDNYLGSAHEFYANIPAYITANMTKSQIVVDLAAEYAKRNSHQSLKKTLLDEMIYFGKQMYFKDKVIPFKTDAEKIGYTPKQLEFAIENENMIWTYFVNKEVLFSTDVALSARFIAEAPFTKFYLDIDNETPGRLGQYIGWQIVKDYMNNNTVDLNTMMDTDALEIFNKSNYKPEK